HFGVGYNFSNPEHMIHIHVSPTPHTPTNLISDIGFTNINTGAALEDGFIAGIDPDGTAFINQQEDKDMLFRTGDGTNNAQRMLIRGEAGTTQGFVGIGQDFSNPQSLLSVDDSNDNTGEVFSTNILENLPNACIKEICL
ncbi:MAG: hypothetical protein U9Q98_02895, partial [Bacteroidota bacterium]|nr:hypothetical protein [Bacteroidota bacterium]